MMKPMICQSSQYYPFIDVAKGLGVFCVLIAHTSWIVGYADSLFTKIVTTFFLGLLFIASGFVSGKIWGSKKNWRDLTAAKNFKILIPFFVVGLCFVLIKDLALTGTISKNPFDRLLTQIYNGGYWYLLSLFVYKMLAVVSSILTDKCKKKGSSRLVIGGGNILILIIIVIVCYYLTNLIGLSIMYQYIGYYIIGMLIFYYSLQKTLLSKDWFAAILLVLTLLIFLVNYYVDTHYPGRSIIIGLVSSVAVFSVLIRTHNNPLVRFFRWIGTFSLDVYVLHYFFILGSYDLIDRQWFVSISWLAQALVQITLTIVLLMCSYIVSKIMRSNPLLSKCILGR